MYKLSYIHYIFKQMRFTFHDKNASFTNNNYAAFCIMSMLLKVDILVSVSLQIIQSANRMRPTLCGASQLKYSVGYKSYFQCSESSADNNCYCAIYVKTNRIECQFLACSYVTVQFLKVILNVLFTSIITSQSKIKIFGSD